MVTAVLRCVGGLQDVTQPLASPSLRPMKIGHCSAALCKEAQARAVLDAGAVNKALCCFAMQERAGAGNGGACTELPPRCPRAHRVCL
jgi:hypothetical protein